MKTADETGFPPMLLDATLLVPASLASLLAVFGPLFTASSFRTFCGLAVAGCGGAADAGRGAGGHGDR
jgi:hypothetical protein